MMYYFNRLCITILNWSTFWSAHRVELGNSPGLSGPIKRRQSFSFFPHTPQKNSFSQYTLYRYTSASSGYSMVKELSNFIKIRWVVSFENVIIFTVTLIKCMYRNINYVRVKMFVFLIKKLEILLELNIKYLTTKF